MGKKAFNYPEVKRAFMHFHKELDDALAAQEASTAGTNATYVVGVAANGADAADAAISLVRPPSA